MDPKDREEFCNSGPDEVTIAREKKRSRRVSFAEITSVHVFDRDEDGGTSSDTKPSFENRQGELPNQPLGFLQDFVDSDDSKELTHNEEQEEEEEDEEDEDQSDLFVRNMNSPGSTIGSATSNEEDNFFGPVSASFIRSGRLSDYAASDDNHDITLDSTAFSLHFRSLVQSESDGNLKTPTRTDLSFEVKTPADNSCTNSGSLMVLTGVDKPTPQRSVSGGKSSGGSDSNDMSLIEDNPHRYDYGRIPPTLDALLAEGSKCMHDVSVPDQIYISKPFSHINGDHKFATPDGFGSEFMVPKDSGGNKLVDIDTRDIPVNGRSSATLTDQISYPSSSSTKATIPADASSIGNQNQIVDELPWGMPSRKDMEPDSDVLKVHRNLGGNCHTFTPLNDKSQMDMSTKHDCADPSHVEDGLREESLKGGISTPGISSHANKCYESPREGSISSLHAKRQQMFIDSAVLNEKSQMDTSAKHDCADPSHVEDGLREESLKDGISTPVISSHANQCYESPMEGSISSLCAKRQQMFIDSAVLSRSELITTPFSKKPPLPSMNKQNIRHGASISSIHKSTSNFKLHGASPIGAMLELGDDNTKPVLSNHLCKSPSLSAILDESNKDPNLKQINASVSESGKSLLNGAQENREQTTTIEMDTYYVGKPKSIRMSTQEEDSVANVNDREGGDQTSAGMFLNDQHSGLTAATLTLSPLSGERKDVQIHSLISHNLTKGTFLSPKSDSSLKIRSVFEEKDQLPCTPINLTHSPLQQLEQKQPASPEPNYISEVQKLPEQYDNIVASGYIEDLRANVADAIHSGSVAEGLQNLGSYLKDNRTSDTSLKENKVHGTSSSVLNKAAHANDFNKSSCITSSEVLRHNLHKESEKIGGYETPLRYGSILNSQSESPDMNFRTRTDPTRFKEKLPGKASSYDSASPYLRGTSNKSYVHQRILTATKLEKRSLEQLSQGANTNEPYTLSKSASRGSGKNPSFSTSMQSSNALGHNVQGLHNLHGSLSVQDIEKSGPKRRIDATMDTDNIYEIDRNRIQKKPKVALEMEECVPISEFFLVKNNEAEKVAGYASPRHWSHIFSKFSEAIKQKLFASADKLNSKEVCVLEDILGRLQKANKYETLCTELQSQKIHYLLGNIQQKRVAEAKRLQQVLVYEQAKLQLLRLKHERLLKKAQLLNSGVQESQLLKLNSSPNLCPPESRDARSKESHLPSGSVDLGRENKEADKKLMAKRQELGALDKKVKNMIKCFLSSCKIEGEPSSDDTIVLVNDHLKKHGICRSIRLNLQVWEVDDLESKNRHHNLVLNYRNFLFQRFTVKVGPVSSIVTINKLDDVNIMKNFPKINASTAFAFVFNCERARDVLRPKNLALETQLTSFLLCNLLDVVEETQMACIELRNLVQTKFHSPCVERLDMQLHFIDFKTGCKLVLTLDMTSLNRGIYPSEILPSQLLTGVSETHAPLSQSLSLEIKTAMRALKSGHSRIIRLCRCVSQITSTNQSDSLYTWGHCLFIHDMGNQSGSATYML